MHGFFRGSGIRRCADSMNRHTLVRADKHAGTQASGASALPRCIQAFGAFSASAVQSFSASAVQRFSASAVQRFSASAVQRFSASAVQRFSASAVQGFSASAVQRFSASAVQGFSASAVQRFSASAIQGSALGSSLARCTRTATMASASCTPLARTAAAAGAFAAMREGWP